MKKLLYIALSAFLFGSVTAQASERIAVVELFTSQGCSSCPPADAFLGELSMRKDVLALAYHVDYWDYIGWKDVHAQAAFTQRQRAYARAFNLRYVYTPQMVISGEDETSGNKRRDVISAIERQLSNQSKISVQATPASLDIVGPDQRENLDVYRVSYHREITTKIRRGENRGKTLTDYNIVSDLERLGNWSGGATSFDFPQSGLDSNQGHAVFIQRPSDLKILAAYRLN